MKFSTILWTSLFVIGGCSSNIEPIADLIKMTSIVGDRPQFLKEIVVFRVLR